MFSPELLESSPILSLVPFQINQPAYATMAVPEHSDLMIKLLKEDNLKITLSDAKELVHTPTRKL
jgi:hypothetical protein